MARRTPPHWGGFCVRIELKMKGLFIVIEGPDGSGKTSQCNLLKDYLGGRAIVTKEPTKTSSVSEKILKVLKKEEQADPCELQRLFAIDRGEHLAEVVRPEVASGKIVISDRYFFSSFAYGALECDLAKIAEFNAGFDVPDITIVLIVKPETCIERLKGRGVTNFEFFEENGKLSKVIDNYKALGQKFPNVHFVDGERSILEVHKEIAKLVASRL